MQRLAKGAVQVGAHLWRVAGLITRLAAPSPFEANGVGVGP
jgi:hypothetical protein